MKNKTVLYGGLLFSKQELNRKVTIHAVYDRFKETGRFESLKHMWKPGMEPQPHVYWDSDAAKWIEAACRILMRTQDDALRQKVESLIDDIIAGQGDDGYFNTYYTVVEPEGRFLERYDHELYCAGHLFEAAVAHYQMSGERRFLDAMMRYADYIYTVFVEEKTAAFRTPGHQEIELALIKLYRVTGKKKYLDLSLFFLNNRGKREMRGADVPSQIQAHLPVREQTEAFGHAVRAMYMYAAMADAAAETGDSALSAACKALFEDVVTRKMYITGGIGSSAIGEAFTIPYDLPNTTAYAETCAAIGLVFFAHRMLQLEKHGKYADTMERCLYNGVLSGLSGSGDRFFYVNPLEINLNDYERHKNKKKVNLAPSLPPYERQKVFRTSCCPPNLSRLLGEIDTYIYDEAEDGIYVNLFAESEFESGTMKISQKTVYPRDGRIDFTCENVPRLYVRIPEWCENPAFSRAYTEKNGYAVIENPTNVTVDFHMQPVLYEANPLVRANTGKAALMYGPVVYCLESIDNPDIYNTYISPDFSHSIHYDAHFGMNVIDVSAWKKSESMSLYQPARHRPEETTVRFIPYCCFANRGKADMLVWFNLR